MGDGRQTGSTTFTGFTFTDETATIAAVVAQVHLTDNDTTQTLLLTSSLVEGNKVWTYAYAAPSPQLLNVDGVNYKMSTQGSNGPWSTMFNAGWSHTLPNRISKAAITLQPATAPFTTQALVMLVTPVS
jgi:hypothetical protein